MKFSKQIQGSLNKEWGPHTGSSIMAQGTTIPSSMCDGNKRHRLSSTMGGQQGLTIKAEKKVTISAFSCKCVYTVDASYQASKCYTSADRMRFKEEAIREGFRIRHLIFLCSLPTERTVQELLKNGMLSCEDLLGINHLCSLNMAEKALNGRQSYTNLVLSAQEELKRVDGFVDAEKLAVIAMEGSFGNVAKAGQPATLALH